MTSHPGKMTAEIFAAMAASRKVCEHLHLPAQAGSNRILKAMGRHYTREEYLEIVRAGRAAVPGLALASDFIVGFPGETEADFEQTAELMREARFQNCFIFKYSPRPGTRAEKMADDVPDAEKARRNHELLRIQEQISREENARKIGATVEIMADGVSPNDPSRWHGRTRQNDIVVFTNDGKAQAGDLVKIRITAATALTLFGMAND